MKTTKSDSCKIPKIQKTAATTTTTTRAKSPPDRGNKKGHQTEKTKT